MEPAKKTLQSKPILIVLAVGLAAFLIYLFFFINPVEVAETLAKTNLAIYSLAFLAYVANTCFSSLTWYRLLNSLEVKASRGKAFLYTWVGLFFEATVPQLGWSAEISKTYMINKEIQAHTGRVGASVVWQKIFNMTLTAAMLSIGLMLVLINYELDVFASISIGFVLVMSILAVSIVYYVSLKPSATKTLLGWAVRVIRVFRKNWNAAAFLAKMEETLGGFHDGVAQLKAKPKALILPIAFSAVSYAFEVSVFFIVFAALGQPIRVDAIFIVFTLTGILQTVGAAFFIPELVTAWTLDILGTNQDVAFSIAILTRAVNLWFRLIVSYGALQYAGVKIMRQNRSRPNVPPAS